MSTYSHKHESKTKKSPNKNSSNQAAQLKDNRGASEKQNLLQSNLDNSSKVLQQKEKAENISNAPIQRVENKTGLPDQLKSGIESLSGMDMSDTRVHYNSSAPAQLQAHAFAQGNNIHIAPGQEQHLPHEAWHVVQQKQGRVKATKQLKGKTAINDDAGLEREADIMGAKAMQMKSVSGESLSISNPTNNVAQRIYDKEAKKDLQVNLRKLNKSKALEILQKIAAQKYTASPEEMEILHNKVNPKRDKFPKKGKKKKPSKKDDGITRLGTRELNNFDSRQDLFEDDINYTQHVIPGHSDLAEIAAKQDEVFAESKVKLTEDQAWALVLAEKEGKHNQKKNRAKALEQLQKISSDYDESDLDTVIAYIKAGKGLDLATNYMLSKTPGDNIGVKSKTKKTLAHLLMNSATFKNVWTTGASQASTDLGRRGGVEESMGYGHILRRSTGNLLKQEKEATFNPMKKEELPKYAALVTDYQPHGVATRYGASVVYWKQSIRNRITHTPGDSWNLLMQGALTSFTSTKYPEALIAYSDENIIRVIAAKATGKDQGFLKKNKEKGITTESYIETQIHGDLTWADVDHIVIGEDEENYEGLVTAFRQHAHKHNLDYTVSTKKARPGFEKKEQKADDKLISDQQKASSGDTIKTRSQNQQHIPRRQQHIRMGDLVRVEYHAHYDVVGTIVGLTDTQVKINISNCYKPRTTQPFRSDHTRIVLGKQLTFDRQDAFLE